MTSADAFWAALVKRDQSNLLEASSRGRTGPQRHPDVYRRPGEWGAHLVSAATVARIRARHRDGVSAAQIARDEGLKRGTAWAIATGKRWPADLSRATRYASPVDIDDT